MRDYIIEPIQSGLESGLAVHGAKVYNHQEQY